MSRFCFITKKKPLFGNKRSYSMNKNKRKFLPNLHNHRFWISSKNKFIKLKVSSKAIKIINKVGIESILNNNKNYKGIKKNG